MLRIYLLTLNRVVLTTIIGWQFVQATADYVAVSGRCTLTTLRLVECTLTAASALLIIGHCRLKLSLLMPMRMIRIGRQLRLRLLVVVQVRVLAK